MTAFDREMQMLLAGIVGLLLLASVVGQVLKRRLRVPESQTMVANLNARVFSWWVMVAIFVAAAALRGVGTTILFAASSFFALREYITLTPTRRADHRLLFWAFFVILPIQYWLVGAKWYGLFSIFIPVYAFLFVPARAVIAGDTEKFLERTAKIQWGLMVCVYFVSYVPALLMLEIPGFEGQNAKLLFFFVTIVQLSDVLQYTWGKLLGRHKVAPTVSPGKTWEGLLGGVLTASLLGMALFWITPFAPWQAGLMSLAIALVGFAGDLTMSAIKRDLGVKDFGELIPGHGGALDRLDSLCFAAPVFFHLTRYFFT